MMLIEGIAALFVLVCGFTLIHLHSTREKRRLVSLDESQIPFNFGFINSVILLIFILVTARISYVIQTPEGSVVFFITLVILSVAIVINFLKIGTRRMRRTIKNQNKK